MFRPFPYQQTVTFVAFGVQSVYPKFCCVLLKLFAIFPMLGFPKRFTFSVILPRIAKHAITYEKNIVVFYGSYLI